MHRRSAFPHGQGLGSLHLLLGKLKQFRRKLLPCIHLPRREVTLHDMLGARERARFRKAACALRRRYKSDQWTGSHPGEGASLGKVAEATPQNKHQLSVLITLLERYDVKPPA